MTADFLFKQIKGIYGNLSSSGETSNSFDLPKEKKTGKRKVFDETQNFGKKSVHRRSRIKKKI
jgi:hypothetical protein